MAKKIAIIFSGLTIGLKLWVGWVVPMFLLNVSMEQWDSSNYSLLHPLRLVVGTKRNPTKQDRCVKFHANIVPEWTKWVPILKINQSNPFMSEQSCSSGIINLRLWFIIFDLCTNRGQRFIINLLSCNLKKVTKSGWAINKRYFGVFTAFN